MPIYTVPSLESVPVEIDVRAFAMSQIESRSRTDNVKGIATLKNQRGNKSTPSATENRDVGILVRSSGVRWKARLALGFVVEITVDFINGIVVTGMNEPLLPLKHKLLMTVESCLENVLQIHKESTELM